MSIHKTSSGKYEVRWRTPDGKQPSATFPTEPEAKAFDSEIGLQLARGSYVDPFAGRVLFREYAEGWLAKRVDLAARSLNVHRVNLDRHVLPVLGDKPLLGIRLSDLEFLVAVAQAKGLKPNTVRGIAHTAKGVLSKAVLDMLIPRDPSVGLRLPRDVSAERVPLTPAEVERLAEQVSLLDTQGRGYGLLILFVAYTGMRWKEVAGLRRRDVDLLRKQVSVRRETTKSDAGVRTLPLTPLLLEPLGAHLAPLAADDLVWTSVSGLRLGPYFHTAFLKPGLRAAGLDPGVRFHDLRHTCAAWLIDLGANHKALQRWMGHATIGVTLDVYGHLFPDALSSLADLLSGYRESRPGDGQASVGKVVGIG